jgi:hypothetical protein
VVFMTLEPPDPVVLPEPLELGLVLPELRNLVFMPLELPDRVLPELLDIVALPEPLVMAQVNLKKLLMMRTKSSSRPSG